MTKGVVALRPKSSKKYTKYGAIDAWWYMLHVFEFDLQGSTKRFTIIVRGVCNSSG